MTAEQGAAIPEDTVNIVDPFGKVGSLPKSQANEAMDNGYKIATPEQVTGAKNEQKYGGIQGPIFSATLGAARAATLGGSDWALTHLPEGIGFSPEEIKGFEETNPLSTTIGEVGGILSDPFGLAKVINTAGKATTAAGKAAIKAAGIAEDSSMAARALHTGAAALGSGVEGALYGGVATSVNEAALGDPSLNGEKILANAGYGAMLGGAAGGLFKVLGFGITPAIKKAVDGLAEIRNELVGSGYGDGENAIVNKILPSRIADAITDRQLNLDTKGQASVLKNMVSSLNTVHDSIQNEIENFESEIDPKAKSALFKSSSKMAGEALSKVSQFISSSVDSIKAAIPEEGKEKLFSALDSLKKSAQFGSFWGGSSERIFNTLQELQKYTAEIMNSTPVSMETAPHLNAIDETIQNLIKDPSIFGPAGAATAIHEENIDKLSEFISQDNKKLTPFQETFGVVKNGKWQFDVQKLNDVLAQKNTEEKLRQMTMLDDFFSHIKEMPDNMLNARRAIPNSKWRSQTLKQIIANSEKTTKESYEDYIEGINTRRPLYGWKDYAPVLIAKWHPVIAAAIEAYDWYQDPVHASHGLALVERILGKTTKKSLDLIDQIFNPSVLSQKTIEGQINVKQYKKEDDHQKIKVFANDPSQFADAMTKTTKELSEYAPNLAQQLHISTGNAVSFLNSKMPQSDDHMNPLGKPYEPSQNEMYRFDRYKQIVDDPLKSLEQIRDRTIGPETVETLSTVYPKLYEQLKQSLLEKAFMEKAKGKIIPFQTKQAISRFLGQPIDSALQSQSILANQAVFATAPQPSPPQANQLKPRAKGLDKMDRAGRLAADYGAMSDEV